MLSQPAPNARNLPQYLSAAKEQHFAAAALHGLRSDVRSASDVLATRPSTARGLLRLLARHQEDSRGFVADQADFQASLRAQVALEDPALAPMLIRTYPSLSTRFGMRTRMLEAGYCLLKAELLADVQVELSLRDGVPRNECSTSEIARALVTVLRGVDREEPKGLDSSQFGVLGWGQKAGPEL